MPEQPVLTKGHKLPRSMEGGDVPMRRLTPEEKQQVEAWALGKAQSEHPNDRVSVLAYDFTDHEGRARCTAVITQRVTVRVEDIKLVHHAGSAGLDDVDAGANEVGHSSEGFSVVGEQPSLE